MVKFKKLIANSPRRTIIIGVLVGAALGLLVWSLVFAPMKPSDENTPPFQAVLPADSLIEDLGGWQKRTPPNNEPYYVYMDTVDSVLVSVSQQPLPAHFKDAPDTNIAEVAKGYNATQTFDVNGSTVYIGTSAKGPQSVIFTKSDLLILILSEGTIDVESWKNYIKSLD